MAFAEGPGQATALLGTPCLISNLQDGDVLSYHAAINTWRNSPPASAGVTSVSNLDGSLTVSPTTGAVITSLNVGNPNSWSALQTFGNNISFGGAALNVSGLATTHLLQFNGTNWVNVTPASFAVTGLVGGTGISITGTTGSVTVTNVGVTSAVAGNGVAVSAATGAVTFSAVLNGTTLLLGVSGLSLNLGNANSWSALQTFGNNISFGGATLSVTSLANGNLLQYNGTNWVNVTAGSFAVTSIVAGTAISVVGTTGAVTVNNTGVTSAVAGNGVSVSSATGAVTFAAVLNGATLSNGASGLSLNLGNANTWTALQTFGSNLSFLGAQVSGSLTSGGLLYYNGTNWVDASDLTYASPTLTLNGSSATIVMKGSGSGTTTLATADSGASNFTITFPAATGTVALTSGANVASVTNSDGTLTISPTTGAVVASLALGHANTWTALQTFSAGDFAFGGYGHDSITSGAKGDIWYYDGTHLVNLAIGSTNQGLIVTGGVPVWGGVVISGTSPCVVATLWNGNTTTTAAYVSLGSSLTTGAIGSGSVLPRTGTVKNLYVFVTANAVNAGDNVTVTVNINGSATAVTVTFAGGSTGSKSDTSHSASVTAGQVITFAFSQNAGASANVTAWVTLEYDS